MLEVAIDERGGDSLPNEDEAIYTKELVSRIESEAENLKLDRVLERLSNFHTDDALLQPLSGHRFTLQHLYFQLVELHKDIYVSLSPGKNKFMVIPGSDLEYYDNPKMFGVEVAERFPQANVEITAAGDCYATGNYTACVFHLMRAVEYGARALVRGLKIKRGGGKDELPHPVELCDWGTIFSRLEEAAKKLPARKSVGASDTRAFYRHAIAQFGNFNDAWRKKVSHTRARYDPHQAMSVMVNTRQFMQHIATRLKEPQK